MESHRLGGAVAAKYILAALAAVFLALGVVRLTGVAAQSSSRTWLLVGAIFAAVSAWLFSQG